MSIYAPGDYVKVEFRDSGATRPEWMWVKVEASDDAKRVILGHLDNEPIVHTDMHLGQKLAVSYDNIREHMKPEQFRQ